VTPPLRLGELVATLALAQDCAFGQPLESQLRSCLLATWMCEEAGLAQDVRETAYWVSLLRYVGCTGHAHETAAIVGDEIAFRAQTLVHDNANPAEVMPDVAALASPGWAEHNSASGCEVADMLVQRMGFGPDVREALRFTFERWNGSGVPTAAIGEAIPMPMRIVHLSHDMEAIGRLFSTDKALEAAGGRRDRTYDPALADLFVTHGAGWFERLAAVQPWDGVLDLEPEPRRLLMGSELDDALAVLADFIDVKSPYMVGHSRRCAALATDAGRGLGFTEAEVTVVRRAALVHELGATGLPNSIWDKPGALTRAELDRVEFHPLLTEQMLGRSPALAELSPVASAHHETCDGSGYPKHLRAADAGPGACVLAAADIYVGMTTDRADRPAHTADDTAAELRKLASDGVLDPEATNAVLAAAGHGEVAAAARARPETPRGRSQREVDVLKLAARGLETKEIAVRLEISPETADHDIEHSYKKIGVSTRAAAALWVTQHVLVR
jgi:HD-GYP domain-containing protein (c-di-GMP phosphodiesterase class II)